MSQQEREPALQQFHRYWLDEDNNGNDPVERLRFFCSLAMSDQDWFDVEPFFDALEAEIEQLRAGGKAV